MVSVTCRAFADEVAEMVEAGQVVEERTRHLEVLVAGNVAVLRVDFHLQLGDEHFEGTDFYTLARLGDSWRITQKVYDMAQVA